MIGVLEIKGTDMKALGDLLGLHCTTFWHIYENDVNIAQIRPIQGHLLCVECRQHSANGNKCRLILKTEQGLQECAADLLKWVAAGLAIDTCAARHWEQALLLRSWYNMPRPERSGK